MLVPLSFIDSYPQITFRRESFWLACQSSRQHCGRDEIEPPPLAANAEAFRAQARPSFTPACPTSTGIAAMGCPGLKIMMKAGALSDDAVVLAREVGQAEL
jgi:hypothetical protein